MVRTVYSRRRDRPKYAVNGVKYVSWSHLLGFDVAYGVSSDEESDSDCTEGKPSHLPKSTATPPTNYPLKQRPPQMMSTVQNMGVVIPFNPSEYDVVSTKLRNWNLTHPGNLAYQELLKRYALQLPASGHESFPSSLMQFGEEIVREVQRTLGGRFLKIQEGQLKPSLCVVMDKKDVLRKVKIEVQNKQIALSKYIQAGSISVSRTVTNEPQADQARKRHAGSTQNQAFHRKPSNRQPILNRKNTSLFQRPTLAGSVRQPPVFPVYQDHQQYQPPMGQVPAFNGGVRKLLKAVVIEMIDGESIFIFFSVEEAMSCPRLPKELSTDIVHKAKLHKVLQELPEAGDKMFAAGLTWRRLKQLCSNESIDKKEVALFSCLTGKEAQNPANQYMPESVIIVKEDIMICRTLAGFETQDDAFDDWEAVCKASPTVLSEEISRPNFNAYYLNGDKRVDGIVWKTADKRAPPSAHFHAANQSTEAFSIETGAAPVKKVARAKTAPPAAQNPL